MIVVEQTPEIKVNKEKLKQKLQPYLIRALDLATDELLKAMQINVHTVTGVGKMTGHGKSGMGAPGDPEWRNELDADLKKLYLEVTNEYIESAVGADSGYGEGTAYRIRAMLIAYGSGSEAVSPNPVTGYRSGRRRIYAGPEGRIVWDDDLADYLEGGSKVKRRRLMPQSFNQVGNRFNERAVEEVKKTFDTIVERAFDTMPDNLLEDCFYQ